MKVLLDTHVFLLMQVDPDRPAPSARRLVEDPRTELLLSAASSWEIAIKYALGRLPLPESPARYVPDRMRVSGVTGMSVTHAHALGVADLPALHRDPFDRLLVVQSAHEGCAILTADAQIAQYDVDVIAAT
ncbi:MAG: type II toxin-antitoxin system VapC family toxin [Actinomycetota bacterium]|nr:type II toxin-antitoxin system VapC family toxin [Actinomycetota bacterium]